MKTDMDTRPYNPFLWLEKLDLGSWLLVIPGTLMICACILFPALLELQSESNEAAKAQAELEYHQARLELHHQLAQSWEAKDPQLLQRLGWHQLRLQREDLRTVNGATPHSQSQHWREWLQPDASRLEAYPRAQPPRESKLTRLLEQPRIRRWIIAAGVFLVFSGLLIAWLKTEPDQDDIAPETPGQQDYEDDLEPA